MNAFKSSMTSLGVWHKPLLGKYKGQLEHSFIAQMHNYNLISPWLDDEESILHIHSFNSSAEPKATLIFLKEGREVYLGRLVPVLHAEALALDDWTYDIQFDNYFICKMVK
jgi:hypothetical protein